MANTKPNNKNKTSEPIVIGPPVYNTQEFGTYASGKGGSRKHRTRKHKRTRRVR